jgi:predicted SnoaL-like aldol condensation-catalyzing enzyme
MRGGKSKQNTRRHRRQRGGVTDGVTDGVTAGHYLTTDKEEKRCNELQNLEPYRITKRCTAEHKDSAQTRCTEDCSNLLSDGVKDGVEDGVEDGAVYGVKDGHYLTTDKKEIRCDELQNLEAYRITKRCTAEHKDSATTRCTEDCSNLRRVIYKKFDNDNESTYEKCSDLNKESAKLIMTRCNDTHVGSAKTKCTQVCSNWEKNCPAQKEVVPSCKGMDKNEMRKTYLKASLKFHPDKNTGCEDFAKAKFQQLNSNCVEVNN